MVREAVLQSARVTIQQAFQTALHRHGSGRLAEAETLYRQILAVQPEHADALHLLGVIVDHSGQHAAGAELILKAIAISPSVAAYHSNLGEVYRKSQRTEEAVAACSRALELKPDYAKAYNNLSAALNDQGRPEQAMDACRRAIHLAPDMPEAHYNLGIALTKQEKTEEAIAAYRKAIQLRPDYPDAYNNLGYVLTMLRRSEEAVAAFERATELRPDFPEAYNNLGNVLKEQGRPDDALASYRRAIQIRPAYAEAHSNLGATLKDQGRLEDAISTFRTAIRLRPDSAAFASNVLLTLHYLPDLKRQTLAAEQRQWNHTHAEPLAKHASAHTNDRDPQRRLRIGCISPDFRDHVVGRYLLPWFEHQDRKRFEMICYSTAHRPDHLTERLRTLAGRWRQTAGVDDARLAEMIHQDKVDILFDLSQHSADNRLPVFARRPAPVQASFAGYPAGAGLEAIGYRISDKYLEGGLLSGDSASHERIFLIDSFWCFAPCGINLAVNDLPAKQSGTVTFGCLNNFCKINEPVLALWAQVLRRVKDSRLVILCPPGSQRQGTLKVLARHGVEATRVEFVEPLPRQGYLELYHRLDLVLDTFPYNGHTTSLDALWMGVPVVSLAGESPVSRAGLSQLSNLGLQQFAAQTEEEFVNVATGWAGDQLQLAHLRATLRGRMEASALMDAPRFARQIEDACRQMWRDWCAGHATSMNKIEGPGK